MTQSLKLRDRMKVESFHKIGEDMTLGEIHIDREKCKGCGNCVIACAGAAIELDMDNKARLIESLPFCMSCGDCVAICPENAIELVDFIRFMHYYRYLDRGEPEWPRKF